MELNFTILQLSLFLLFSLLLVAQAKLFLDPSDYKAFKLIQRDLGINDHHPSFTTTPCNSPAVSCERRVADYSSVLKIIRIAYDSQQLDGFISPEIGRLSELRELTLVNNHLVDQIPDAIVDCRKLEVLNLKNNHFTGRVPDELSKLVRLRVLDLSTNEITGDLSFLRYFSNLETLSLANNLFTGKSPAALKSFRNLQFFNISGNGYIRRPSPVLNGVEYISSEVSRKSLVPRRYILEQNSTRSNRISSATHRASSGPAQAPAPSVPKPKHHKHTKEVLLSFLAGGLAINYQHSFYTTPCGSAAVSCNGTDSVIVDYADATHKPSISTKRKLGIIILGMFIGANTGIIVYLVISVLVKIALILIYGKRSTTKVSIFSKSIITKAEDLSFLDKKDALDTLQFIGKGGCGEVYKAELPSNVEKLAIKKIVIAQQSNEVMEITSQHATNKMLDKKMRQIQAEVLTIGKVQHRNLLPLLAHVAGHDCHYLVYEYMKNGSLQDIMTQVALGKRELDWPSRYKIALGVATGLEYLHINASPRIIHRDLKPGNILLDEDMEPRIADFGLAKRMPVEDSHMSVSKVAGTVGYIAPDYFQTMKLTDKSDIYSLGVILGGLTMGKLPGDEFFLSTREMSLVLWMRNMMSSAYPERALDPQLMGNGYDVQMLQVLKIACFCTFDHPRQRPNSKDVRYMLLRIGSISDILPHLHPN